MPVPPLRYEIDFADTLADLTRVEELLSPVGMAYFMTTEVGPYLRERAKYRFEAEGDDVSGQWAPLSPVTQSIRESNPDWPVGPSHPINKRTGELEYYVTQSTPETFPTTLGATTRYPGRAPSGGELKSKMETAQRGRAQPKTVPRPVLGVNETDLLFVMTRLTFWLGGGVVPTV